MKINISNTTYIFILLSFLSGYFEYVFLFLLIILIHECGHLIFGKISGINNIEIILYPFGGITKYDEKLNISIKKELLCLIGGITFQILFYLLILYLYKNFYITDNVYNKIHKIHTLLIYFNFMPILPLDGGKIINIFLDMIFPYKKSYIISIIISLIFIVYFSLNNITYFSIFLTLFLIKYIIIEIKNISIKYNKFLLERYLYKYNFKKIRIIRKIDNLKRDYYHIIGNMTETVFLSKLFDRKW